MHAGAASATISAALCKFRLQNRLYFRLACWITAHRLISFSTIAMASSKPWINGYRMSSKS